MLLKLIRNKPQGNSITGRLVIDGRWFCNTLERKGYEILALFYPVKVTQSPRFKRLLPLVCGVPQRSGIRFHRGNKPEHSTGCVLVLGDQINNNLNNINQQHSAGEQYTPAAGSSLSARCVVASATVVENKVVDVVDNRIPVGTRTSADVEQELTQLLLKAQNAHEEIILEVIDYSPGTQYGYDHPCPRELQKP